MRYLIPGFLLALALLVGSDAAAVSVNGGTLTFTRGDTVVHADGSATETLLYANASGVIIHIRNVTVSPDHSTATDQWGNVVASGAGLTSIGAAINTFGSALDTANSAAAAANKLNL